MAQVGDEQLREMALHRGLKLVKSRRRKPGVGDFGKFGLSDAAGAPLLGFSDDGLTASAEDIQHYLRSSELGTWQQSAQNTPDPPASSKKPRGAQKDTDRPVPRRTGKPSPTGQPALPVRAKPAAVRRRTGGAGPKREPKPEPAPEPVLRVRAAGPADCDALSALLSQLGNVALDRNDVAGHMTMAGKAKAGILVAELDEIVGCCGWAVVPTYHRGAVGRLTVLVVDKQYRRRGIAAQMLAAAQQALHKYGCRQIEAMSDITINNSHNFFRSLGFEQTSYRFARNIRA